MHAEAPAGSSATGPGLADSQSLYREPKLGWRLHGSPEPEEKSEPSDPMEKPQEGPSPPVQPAQPPLLSLICPWLTV